jgi:hypothetical protein
MVCCGSAFMPSSIPAAAAGSLAIMGEREFDRQRSQVLLRAVVYVTLETTTLGIAAGDDSCAGFSQLRCLNAQLGEGVLERAVELVVVQRDPCWIGRDMRIV